MNLIDSCGWIEFLTDGGNSGEYAKYLADSENIITPTIVIFEVYKKVLKEYGEETALMVVAQMNGTNVIDLTVSISLFAAEISLKYKLPLADAIVYATAKIAGCKVITSDKHFVNLDSVVFI